jgi:CheY-like chemotaxis protein/nitrogen-specific signal transduction histidine kinase
MPEDWRFRQSPHVDEGGLRAYAGVPLRFQTDFGDHVAFGSLCVASNSPQASLNKAQQQSLARLADWIVTDIIHSARLRRQRERQWMLELLAEAEKQCSKGVNMEAYIPEMLRTKYPTATVCVCKVTDGETLLEGGTVLKTTDLQNGLWEDSEYFDYIVQERNHQDMFTSRVVRVISSECASQRTPTFLLVSSKDFRDVYDDIDSWFVMMCAGLLCRYWQGLALKDALDAKEAFLRGITHQLRTPIHGILGSVELLTEELKSRNIIPRTSSSFPYSTPDVEMLDPYVYIKTIGTAAKELTSTVNSLIKLNQWAHVAQKEGTIAFHKIGDIETALLEASSPALSEDVSSRPSVVFRHNFPPYLDMLFIDLRLLLDCIQPLIVNAIQNTGGGVVVVTLSFTADCNRLVVDVEDNGRGIAPQDHDRIFAACENFGSHTIEAGLGVTLACKLANMMNGAISLVSSEIGKGSHFRAAFDELVCASSFPPRQLIKERLAQLPPTFYEMSPPSTSLSLCRITSNLLAIQGYTASKCREGSLVLLDYKQDLDELYNCNQQFPMDQIAICPVPESAIWFVDFQTSRVQRKNNIIYVKAPLLSSTLEEALELADAVIAEVAPSLPERLKCDFGGGAPDTTEPASYPPVVNSAPDKGDRRSIYTLSIRADSVQSLGRPLPKPSLNNPIEAAKPMTLLVDDNVVNLRLLEMYCTRRSIPYRTAKDGEEAVSTFLDHRASSIPTFDPLLRQELTTPVQRVPFALVLMDLQMPICNGIFATRRIRELEKENGWGRSIIFIITGQDSPGDRADADEAGADGYLVKPVGPKALDQWFKQWFHSAGIG